MERDLHQDYERKKSDNFLTRGKAITETKGRKNGALMREYKNKGRVPISACFY